MATRLHYYGSVFKLDPNIPDDDWYDFITKSLHLAVQDGRSGILVVSLKGGKEATIPIFPDAPVVLVRSVSAGYVSDEPTLRIYWNDNTGTNIADLLN
ncbi:MAG: hypothetical protein KGL39_26500 [Patescibacteria group bacterium]|nr:hypothetical protein [Patescibacteria group bacterium]